MIGKEIFENNNIFIDTAPFIYLIEKHPVYFNTIYSIAELFDAGKLSVITSVITLTEVLVIPFKEKNDTLITAYKNLIKNSDNFHLLEITSSIAEKAAQVISTYNLKTPDGIQIASAIEFSADIFLTNDSKLKRITEIQVITHDEMIN